jgi:TM2 domain-containing membrane protein YozV
MPQKIRPLALFLAAFPLTGIFGVDRFYLGKTKSGIAKALTLGGLGLWWFFDFAALSIDNFLWVFGKDEGFVKDGEGRELKYGLSAFRWKNGQLVRGWSD